MLLTFLVVPISRTLAALSAATYGNSAAAKPVRSVTLLMISTMLDAGCLTSSLGLTRWRTGTALKADLARRNPTRRRRPPGKEQRFACRADSTVCANGNSPEDIGPVNFMSALIVAGHELP
ncbi:hypothetical protein [Arthrobacter sp. A5]|uniref:hypothetical protein n=1 Tax=Arthrobacter sp. A5 TaxID=576926 RepID=UPI003DA8B855